MQLAIWKNRHKIIIIRGLKKNSFGREKRIEDADISKKE
jgi:hypothetical protein